MAPLRATGYHSDTSDHRFLVTSIKSKFSFSKENTNRHRCHLLHLLFSWRCRTCRSVLYDTLYVCLCWTAVGTWLLLCSSCNNSMPFAMQPFILFIMSTEFYLHSAVKSQRSLWGRWCGFPGFQHPLHSRGSRILVAWLYVHFCHSGNLLSLLNQSHHLCKGELLCLCGFRSFCCEFRVWMWRRRPVQLLIRAASHTGRRAPLFVAGSVNGLDKPVREQQEKRRFVFYILFLWKGGIKKKKVWAWR